MDYLKAGGVDTSKVEIAKFGDAGNGLRATTALAKGDNFLQIPVGLMMSTETAKTSSVAKFIAEDPLVCQMPNVTLALHVLAELGRGAASQWAPYIATLPATYTTPLCVNTPPHLLTVDFKLFWSSVVTQSTCRSTSSPLPMPQQSKAIMRSAREIDSRMAQVLHAGGV